MLTRRENRRKEAKSSRHRLARARGSGVALAFVHFGLRLPVHLDRVSPPRRDSTSCLRENGTSRCFIYASVLKQHLSTIVYIDQAIPQGHIPPLSYPHLLMHIIFLSCFSLRNVSSSPKLLPSASNLEARGVSMPDEPHQDSLAPLDSKQARIPASIFIFGHHYPQYSSPKRTTPLVQDDEEARWGVGRPM